MTRIIILTALLLLCNSCIHAPQKAYHFLYCNKMNIDGKHCDQWATPCGRLKCPQ